jgi:hypothetical protein
MESLAERKNGEARTGVERKLFIRNSNSCVVCPRLMAKGSEWHLPKME